jgi:hypothetical protein
LQHVYSEYDCLFGGLTLYQRNIGNQGNKHLLDILNEVVDSGREGLMLNEPNSLYIQERIKVKVSVYRNCYFNLTLDNSFKMIVKFNFYKLFQQDCIANSKNITCFKNISEPMVL